MAAIRELQKLRKDTCPGKGIQNFRPFRGGRGGSQQGLVFRSDSVAILYDLGLCFIELGDRTSALAQYEKLLELDRDTASLLFRKIYP